MKDLKLAFVNLTKANQLRIHRIAKHIDEKLLPNPFTFDPLICSEPKFGQKDFRSLYYVSLDGHEQPYERRPKYPEIVTWVCEHYEVLCKSSHYIGCWIYQRTFYFDISIAVLGKERALKIGSENGQDFIYHLATGAELPVSKKTSQSGLTIAEVRLFREFSMKNQGCLLGELLWLGNNH